ncbi:MAG: hypothetical protein LV479_07015 [Methylacidiphilales bacterium]|nr:hypothetical protein [Candidatus Methylacidiphilales bacterium]
MKKSLDQKLQAIRQNSGGKTFILADAKDADMAWGIASPGSPWPADPARPFRSMPEFCQDIRAIVRQELVDIMLASVSVMHQLAHEERLFDHSPVTPAIRANDTTDVWIARGARYRQQPSRAFSTCYIEEAQFGGLATSRQDPPTVNLGLYSITFTNDLATDHANLETFRAFRAEAERRGFRYFLEVFDPNTDAGLTAEQIPAFVNDSIVRTLAAVPAPGRPQFLKIAYHGPRWLEELVNYDPSVVVGILGGGAGTTLDAFKLLADAQKYGARVALYGRKIKEAEDPLAFIRHLRLVVDEGLDPAEAVRSYHRDLQKQKLPAKRSLEDDLQITHTILHY